ncbi:hypothetical protein [Exiguobacterium chiriqhucha]|uniref:hypothetical protein n=1 Tax=Exiguobacterium chiriqhucha TaxID=1385984 RepID=UPI001365EA7C|nr:hypothetical protein [Exiguobacterium chiriqhucha]
MKRAWAIGGVVLILFLGWQFVDTNRLFADVYYTKVPNESAEHKRHRPRKETYV